ncbi:MAG: hypothetical protein KJ687_02390 [Proteobacteria bacterium]|nr:hypothetical protein [Pseudomonadota bacterium]
MPAYSKIGTALAVTCTDMFAHPDAKGSRPNRKLLLVQIALSQNFGGAI